MAKSGRIASGGAYQSSKALVGAGVIHLVPGILYWSFNDFKVDMYAAIYLGGFTLFVLMAIWARWSPLVPSLVCAALYINLLCLQLPNIAHWNVVSWIIQIAIVSLIGIAVYGAFQQRRRERSEIS